MGRNAVDVEYSRSKGRNNSNASYLKLNQITIIIYQIIFLQNKAVPVYFHTKLKM